MNIKIIKIITLIIWIFVGILTFINSRNRNGKVSLIEYYLAWYGFLISLIFNIITK